MNLTQLLPLADGWETLAQVEENLRRGRRFVLLEGTPLAAKGWLLARVAQDLNKPLVVVTYNDDQAARLAEDLGHFLSDDKAPRLLPSSLPLLLDDEESGHDVGRAGKRMAALTALASDEPLTIVASATAILQRTPPREAIKARRVRLAVGETVNLDALAARLTAFGYTREDQVNVPGSFARRGDLVDVFPSDGDQPIRVDLFGDEIESIRLFDRDTQRSEGKIDALVLVPAHEVAFTRENMIKSSETLRTLARKRIGEMERAGEGRDRIERLRDAVDNDVTRLGQAVYFPGVERYLPLLHPNASCVLDFLPADALLVLDEPGQLRSHAERDLAEVAKNLRSRAERGELLDLGDPACLDFEQAMQQATRERQTLLLSLLARSLGWIHPDVQMHVSGAPAEGFAGRPGALAEALDTYNRNKVRVAIVSAQAPRVRGLLNERKLPESPLPELYMKPPPPALTPQPPLPTLGEGWPEAGVRAGAGARGGIALVNGVLRSGFRLPDARLVVLTDAEIFGTGTDKPKPRRREFRGGLRITSLLDLKDNDFVVHIHHGIGVFHGLTKLSTSPAAGLAPVEREYLLIQYEGGDKLYVPVDQVDRVQKYIGPSDGDGPPVSRLGGQEWARTTAKAQRAVREIAKDLIELYAARQSTSGHAYSPDTPWQTEMEDAFPYTETPDQAAAIEDVKRDLEAPRPMDRLICGDVGYGKTEVAIRAAFKVAGEGRQVAILCPTTVLAAQHFSTFSERLQGFPLKVDMLSRFRSFKEQQWTLEELKIGAVDIVIGTHRLLSKDIAFKDLGLVIVDEEQRFGVTHKEKLKQLRKTVDVLTMTATPIPRTLHMSLGGIRDMSLINDPPEGRTPVKTLIKEYDDDLIRETIGREVERGGQVYFVHNRVESIYHVAAHLEKVVPQARFRIAHGQMNEDELEEGMLDFYEHKFDVLVCTTIIESGLDISNVNTILIDNADKLGLAQLYQLRGRVGRSRRQAYAVLMYRKHKQLSEIAEQRLGALREFSDLGSGYKIALRDLELRGAGNLLGAEQSGTVALVGFDLYTQLLEQAVREFKGDAPDPLQIPLPTVDLPIAASIPEKYIPSEPQRILMYKKIAAVREKADVARLQEEFEDRFGDPPAPVWNALALLRLRLRCQEIGIESITTEDKKITITFKKGVRLPVPNLRPLQAAFKAQGHTFAPERVVLNVMSSKLLPQVEEMVEVLARALTEKAAPPPSAPPASPRKPVAGRR